MGGDGMPSGRVTSVAVPLGARHSFKTSISSHTVPHDRRLDAVMGPYFLGPRAGRAMIEVPIPTDVEEDDAMLDNPMATPRSDDVDPRHLHAVAIPCLVCHQPFLYRHVGPFRDETLMPIDRVCRPCFPLWYHAWAQGTGWLDGRPNSPAASE